MKNDIKFPGLDNLIKKMGAEEVAWNSGDTLDKIELKPIEYTTLASALEDHEIGDNGIIYKNGRPRILYIMEPKGVTIHTLENDPKADKGPPRYHITGVCSTIKQKERDGSKDRYVSTPDIFEKFSVYGYPRKSRTWWGGEGNQEKVENVELAVCINCLKHVNYEEVNTDYYSKTRLEWAEGYEVETWFEDNVQEKFMKPKYSKDNYPKPGYDNPEFIRKKNELKKQCKYVCQNCELDCSNSIHKRLLHCDHIDGNTGNNAYSNLRIICVDCHRYLGQEKRAGSQLHFNECIDLKKKQGKKIYS